MDRPKVVFPLPTKVGAYGVEERVIRPAALAMADRLKQGAKGRRIVMGNLELPDGVSQTSRVRHDRFSVRGLVDYSIWENSNLMRFDVICGYERAA